MPTPLRPPRLTFRHGLLSLAALALALAAGWAAVQGGWRPIVLPGLTPVQTWTQIEGKAAGVIYQGLAALPFLIAYGGAVLGWGWWIQDRWLPHHRARHILRMVLGLAVMLLIAWGMGVFGLLNRWTAWLPCIGGFLIAAWKTADRSRRGLWEIEHWPTAPWTVMLALPAGALLLVAATCPPGSLWAVEAFGYDTLSYHLQLPREWLAGGRISGLDHNVYSYLPDLVEAGYMHLAALGGGTLSTIYLCQWWHALTALLAAATLAMAVRRWVGAAGAALTAATFLATPWVVVTASSAYDEAAALALASGALLLLLEDERPSATAVWWAGLLLGTATLAKLTIGLLCVPTLVALVLVRMHGTATSTEHADPWRRRMALGGLCVLGVLLVVSPWLIRNALWTGNPVFPFATSTLGHGHWAPWQVEAWQRSSSGAGLAGWSSLGPRWLWNTGYGTLGGSPAPTDGADITRFHREGGIPVLWLAVMLATLAALNWSRTRRMAVALLALMLAQALIWLLATHQQARFLLPTLLPGCFLIGLGYDRLAQRARGRLAMLAPLAAVLLMVLLTYNLFDVFFHQTRMLTVGADSMREPAYRIVDNLPTQADAQGMVKLGAIVGDHVLNYLPAGSKPLLVAEAAVLYIRGPIAYATVFDRSPLGDAVRQVGPDPPRIAAALRQQGFTHVWVNLSELERLVATYGGDPDVTLERVHALSNAWHTAADYGWARLLVLPDDHSTSATRP